MSSNRTFTISSATTVKGCKTKIPRNSRYLGTAVAAAKKAHTVLCGRKRIKGSCTFIITMRETTQGSAKKLYTYKVTRRLLDEPVELDNGVSFDYEVIAKKATRKKKSKNCRKQSSGRIRSSRGSRRGSRGRSGRSRAKPRKPSKRSHRLSSSAKNIISDVHSGLGPRLSRSSKNIISDVHSGLAKRSSGRIQKSVSSRKADEFMKQWKKSRKSPARKKSRKSRKSRKSPALKKSRKSPALKKSRKSRKSRKSPARKKSRKSRKASKSYTKAQRKRLIKKCMKNGSRVLSVRRRKCNKKYPVSRVNKSRK